ncbi:MAG: hypothetical protein Q8R04_03365 [Nanoarchaeota archaeon]|nr:hypothetical protein [Nanoarchaeota archaeon]
MRFFYFILLALLIVSCVTKSIETKEPKIDIISPKNNEMIKDGKILLKLNISNFKLVTPDTELRQGQGHIQVWIDDMEFRGAKTEFVFENESDGTHQVKAELMLSNNTVLPYSRTIKVVLNKT